MYDEIKTAGAEVVAISVDPPARSASMSDDIGIGFPVLSDSSRATIIEWDVLNELENGGIAKPATFVVDRERVIRLRSVEQMMARIAPREMLDFIRAMTAGSPEASDPSKTAKTPKIPKTRGVIPGLMFLRAISNGFRHGVRVKRE